MTSRSAKTIFQMAAYLGRFASPDGLAWGVLAYPDDPSWLTVAPAEELGPWSLEGRKKVVFASRPHDVAVATGKVRDLIAQITSVQADFRARA